MSAFTPNAGIVGQAKALGSYEQPWIVSDNAGYRNLFGRASIYLGTVSTGPVSIPIIVCRIKLISTELL
jgi:hypothetical protein